MKAICTKYMYIFYNAERESFKNAEENFNSSESSNLQANSKFDE